MTISSFQKFIAVKLIIFCFRRFSLKKNILQSQQKKFYTINTDSLSANDAETAVRFRR